MLSWFLLAALAATPAPPSAPSAPPSSAVLGPVPPPGPGGQVWTLDRLLDLAKSSQPDVRDARLRAGEARADLRTAGLYPNPQLQVGLSNVPLEQPADPAQRWSDVFVWSAGLSQEVVIGKRGKRESSAESGVAQADAELADVSRTSRFELERAFLQALWAEERQRLAAESLARYLDSVKLVRARFLAGEDAGADVNKIELEKLRYATEARESARAAVEARAELFHIAGVPGKAGPDRVDGSFPTAKPPRDLAPLVQRALDTRPDLRALQAARQKAERDLALAKAQAIPDLTVGLGYAYSPTEISSGTTSSLGLTLSVPLPLFDRNQGEVQKAELQLERAQLAESRARADAEREVRLAAGHIASANEAVQELESNYLGRADRALHTAEQSYKDGKASLLEVLEAQRTRLETRADYVDALLDRGVAALELQRAMGMEAAP